jgi:hypothetical protein
MYYKNAPYKILQRMIGREAKKPDSRSSLPHHQKVSQNYSFILLLLLFKLFIFLAFLGISYSTSLS